MKKLLFLLTFTLIFPRLAFAGPQSSSYEIIEYGFGSGGTSSNESTNYSLFGTLGEVEYNKLLSTDYALGGGLIFTMKANVPPAPTVANNGNWYNKLLLTINEGGNPSDTKYAVAATDDNWTTTYWLQSSDNTLSTTLGIEDYQTYSNWGSGSGEYMVGLNANKTYRVKVKALQGIYTESELSSETAQITDPVRLSFDIDIGPTSGASTDAPYNVDLGVLSIGSITTGSDKIWIDLSTNAEWGGFVYLYGTYTGLRSTAANHTINSVTNADISALSEAYGLQAANSSGLTAKSPYDVTSNAVGIVDTSFRAVFDSGGASVSNGRGSLTVKVKTSTTTSASSDYTDTLTLIASGTF